MQYAGNLKRRSTPRSKASFELALLKGMWQYGTRVGQREREREREGERETVREREREREREMQRDISEGNSNAYKMFGDII